jgi:hypothetical protein
LIFHQKFASSQNKNRIFVALFFLKNTNMKQSQSNYLNMANAVLQHFDNHAAAWSNVRIAASGVEKVRSTVNAIHTAAVKQNENNPVGYTASKEQARDSLETTLYQTALRVRSYAGVIGNEVLTQKTRFSRSSLDLLKTGDLCVNANTLADACEENLAGLAEYQVDQAAVDRLRELAAQTQTLYARRDTVVDERMEATARLKQLLLSCAGNSKRSTTSSKPISKTTFLWLPTSTHAVSTT